jgi:outer membrane receptor protein involved in Fe transport
MKNRLFILLSLFPLFAIAEEPVDARDVVTLSPVIAEGTAAEVLKHDRVVPAIQGKTNADGSNGAITRDLMNQVPLHFGDNGRAGNATQASGYTKTAEEIDVNVLGIPLNGSQGGGFNLSSFPQYLWSGFAFQLGPSMGAYDPRGTFGSLGLRLWSADAISSDDTAYRFTAFHSTSQVQQFSVGADYGKTFAGNVGWSLDRVKGPSGSFSGRVLDDGKNLMKMHLLATQQTVTGFLSERANNPTAEYGTVRFIPVLQYDRKFSDRAVLKTVWFYDNNYLKTDDSVYYANGVQYRRARAVQGGLETALVLDRTKIGVSVRQADYKVATRSWVAPSTLAESNYEAKTEQFINTQATHSWDLSDTLYLEPTVGGTAVTRFGFYPSASLGLRKFLERREEAETDAFLRVGSVPRFPSIIDRYPTYAGVTDPNPGLKPERVASVETGLNRTARTYRSSLTFYGRKAWDTRDYRPYVIAGSSITPGQIINNGQSYYFGGIYVLNWTPNPWITPMVSAHWSRSRFTTANKPMPFNPEWIGLIGIDVHEESNRFGLAVNQRLSTGFHSINENSSAYTKLPGYGYTDVFLRAEIVSDIEARVGAQNLFDREIQFRAGQPTRGREFVFMASGVF